MKRRYLVRAVVIGALIVGLSAGCSDSVESGSSTKLKLTHKLEHGCLAVGQTQTLSATTEPAVNIAFVTQYSDRLFHGETPKGYTNSKGVFKRSWVIPSDAPVGTADLRIIGAKKKKTVNVVLNFEVVPEGQTCP